MLKFLRILLFVAAGFLLVANIEPYIAATGLIFGKSSVGNVCSTISGVAFVGGILGWICTALGSIVGGLAGFLVWAIFQAIEILPIATWFNVPFISGMLRKLQGAPQVSVDESDRESVAVMKQRHNTVVERSLSTLLAFSWLVYLVDLALMCWLYSPLNEMGEVNWAALARTLLGVFGVEIIVLAISLLDNIIDPKTIQYRSSRHQPEVKEY